MKEYKATLHLPETAFPMRGELAEREPARIQRWVKNRLYQQIRNAKKGCPLFILHDGPPYANGDIHLGHAVNKILKDIIIKAQGFSGYDAVYIPGWDCHGLPIELKVEQQLGKEGQQVTPAQFHQACRQYAMEQVARQKEDFIRLGILGDWEQPYLTMSSALEAETLRVLGRVIANGHLYRGVKPVHWCTVCHSALAEAELEYREKSSLALDVRFQALDGTAVRQRFGLQGSGDGPLSVVIWTTTPWTLPANRAVAVHPELSYHLVQTHSPLCEQLLLAAEQVEPMMRRWQITHWQVIGTTVGREVAGLYLQHPFCSFVVPLITSEHVTVDTGTGAVHIAPGHGPEDFTLGQHHGLEVVSQITADGCYLPQIEGWGGKEVFTAEPAIVERLQQKGTLLYQETIQHSYPHCWRHSKPTLFRTTLQWFISMTQAQLRQQMLQQIEHVAWVPLWGKERMAEMVAQRPDWCISRQRNWGVPLAFFVHRKSGALHPRTVSLLEQIATRIEQQGLQGWWALDPKELLGDEAAEYERVTDILDVWFDSGATHATVVAMRPELRGEQAHLYLEGSDQYRGWFMSSLVIATAICGQAPYRQVVTHGFTVDSQGCKMSKSLGNVITPRQIINTLGSDILRLWVASTDYRAEMVLSESALKSTSDIYRRIRNTARFLLANLKGFDPQQQQLPVEQMVLLDRWAVSCAAHAQQEIRDAYTRYDFHGVVQRLMQFCSVEMGSFYLDIIKDRQYTAQKGSLAHRSCQTALYYLVEALVRWIAPIVSFTADEIWQYLPGERLPFVWCETWYSHLYELPVDAPLNHDHWQILLRVRGAVNQALEQARRKNLIGSALAAEITLYVEPQWAYPLQKVGEELHFLFITSAAHVVVQPPPLDAHPTEVAGVALTVKQATGNKCPRCWHYTPTLTASDLCTRCISNIDGEGEQRYYV